MVSGNYTFTNAAKHEQSLVASHTARLLPLSLLLVLHTYNNTDGKKLDINRYSFVPYIIPQSYWS